MIYLRTIKYKQLSQLKLPITSARGLTGRIPMAIVIAANDIKDNIDTLF